MRHATARRVAPAPHGAEHRVAPAPHGAERRMAPTPPAAGPPRIGLAIHRRAPP